MHGGEEPGVHTSFFMVVNTDLNSSILGQSKSLKEVYESQALVNNIELPTPYVKERENTKVAETMTRLIYHSRSKPVELVESCNEPNENNLHSDDSEPTTRHKTLLVKALSKTEGRTTSTRPSSLQHT